MINLDYLIGIGLSLLLSGLIGLERETQKKSAGLRDAMFICLGATMFTIISLVLREVEGDYDIGRIIAYTIAGVGFLGGGIMIQNKNKISGITTASMLWAIVGIGILCGLGEYVLATICAGCIYFVLKLKHIKIRIETFNKRR